MKLTINKLSIAFSALATLSIAGCGGSAPPSPTASDTGSAAPASTQQTTSTTTQGTGVEVVSNGVKTEPAQVVAVFLDSLRSGDEKAANGVLTMKAQQELAKTDYVMQPLGDSQGKFQIGRVVYPTPEDKTVALVESVWVDPPAADGTQQRLEIVCEVHQDPAGWGISGIGVTIPGTEQALVLDFEDGARLQATIDAATGQTAQTQRTVPAQTVSSQQLPGYPAGAQTQGTQMQQTQQIPQQSMPQYQGSQQQATQQGQYPQNSLRPAQTYGTQQQMQPAQQSQQDGSFPDLPLPPVGGN